MCSVLVWCHCCIVQLDEDRAAGQLCDPFMLSVTVERLQSQGILRALLSSKV